MRQSPVRGTAARRAVALINGERGGYLGYAMWSRYLKLAQGYTAADRMASSSTPPMSCGTCARPS
jgi:hypothetical protein